MFLVQNQPNYKIKLFSFYMVLKLGILTVVGISKACLSAKHVHGLNWPSSKQTLKVFFYFYFKLTW